MENNARLLKTLYRRSISIKQGKDARYDRNIDKRQWFDKVARAQKYFFILMVAAGIGVVCASLFGESYIFKNLCFPLLGGVTTIAVNVFVFARVILQLNNLPQNINNTEDSSVKIHWDRVLSNIMAFLRVLKIVGVISIAAFCVWFFIGDITAKTFIEIYVLSSAIILGFAVAQYAIDFSLYLWGRDKPDAKKWTDKIKRMTFRLRFIMVLPYVSIGMIAVRGFFSYITKDLALYPDVYSYLLAMSATVLGVSHLFIYNAKSIMFFMESRILSEHDYTLSWLKNEQKYKKAALIITAGAATVLMGAALWSFCQIPIAGQCLMPVVYTYTGCALFAIGFVFFAYGKSFLRLFWDHKFISGSALIIAAFSIWLVAQKFFPDYLKNGIVLLWGVGIVGMFLLGSYAWQERNTVVNTKRLYEGQKHAKKVNLMGTLYARASRALAALMFFMGVAIGSGVAEVYSHHGMSAVASRYDKWAKPLFRYGNYLSDYLKDDSNAEDNDNQLSRILPEARYALKNRTDYDRRGITYLDFLEDLIAVDSERRVNDVTDTDELHDESRLFSLLGYNQPPDDARALMQMGAGPLPDFSLESLPLRTVELDGKIVRFVDIDKLDKMFRNGGFVLTDRNDRVLFAEEIRDNVLSQTLNTELGNVLSNSKNADVSMIAGPLMLLHECMMMAEDRLHMREFPQNYGSVVNQRLPFAILTGGGGSTLLTQIVKNINSEGQQTHGIQEKALQMVAALVTAYSKGLDTREIRREILYLYENTTFLGTTRCKVDGTTREVNIVGLADALYSFFGRPIEEVILDLAISKEEEKDPAKLAKKARALKQVAIVTGMVKSPGRYVRDRYFEADGTSLYFTMNSLHVRANDLINNMYKKNISEIEYRNWRDYIKKLYNNFLKRPTISKELAAEAKLYFTEKLAKETKRDAAFIRPPGHPPGP